jgi:hypothetical protein
VTRLRKPICQQGVLFLSTTTGDYSGVTSPAPLKRHIVWHDGEFKCDIYSNRRRMASLQQRSCHEVAKKKTMLTRCVNFRGSPPGSNPKRVCGHLFVAHEPKSTETYLIQEGETSLKLSSGRPPLRWPPQSDTPTIPVAGQQNRRKQTTTIPSARRPQG